MEMKITVKSGGAGGWSDKYSASDLFVEAAIKSLKSRCKEKAFQVSPVIQCLLGRQQRIFNTYYLLLLGGMQHEAELLRKKMLDRFDIDLKAEAVEGPINENTIRICQQ